MSERTELELRTLQRDTAERHVNQAMAANRDLKADVERLEGEKAALQEAVREVWNTLPGCRCDMEGGVECEEEQTHGRALVAMYGVLTNQEPQEEK